MFNGDLHRALAEILAERVGGSKAAHHRDFHGDDAFRPDDRIAEAAALDAISAFCDRQPQRTLEQRDAAALLRDHLIQYKGC